MELESDNPAAEPEIQTAEEAEGQSEAVENDSQETGDSHEQAEEFDEIEYEGERYQVPKKLKAGFMLQSDYTKKTMEVAEQRKAFETQQKEFQRKSEAQTANLRLHAEAYSLHQQLEQYNKLDWNKITDEDPVQAMKLDREYRTLKESHAQRVHAISEYENQRAIESQQSLAKRLDESRATIQKEIPNWSPELAQNLNSYGTSLGFSMDEVSASVYDPRQVKVLNKAYLYDQLMKKQSQQKQPVPEAKPVKTIGKANKATTGLSDDLPADEWMKRRNAQLLKRRS